MILVVKSEGKRQNGAKDKKAIYAYYVELESPLDLARQAFDYSSGHIKAVMENGRHRLFFVGEKFGDVRFVYYVTIDRMGKVFVYTPMNDSKEKFDILDKATEHIDYKSYRVPLIELSMLPYTEVKDMKKAGNVIKIEVKDPDMLVKSLASYAHANETPPKLYAFYNGKDHIMGTFEFFHEGGVKIFTYAKAGAREVFGALFYNFTADSIEPTNSFVEKSGIYIRIINLKKTFPFF